jgi:riboflavin biosynthesis pyrimidine reductase
MTRAVETLPNRERARAGEFRLRELFAAPVEAERTRGGTLPAALAEHYDGDLRIPLRTDRPTVIANFVTTLDGVVAFDGEGLSGGGEVSGFYEPDRFVMGLLRSLADVVLVGAGTVRAAPKHEWTARHVHRRSAGAYAEFRRASGVTSTEPTTMVVTARGGLDPQHPGLSAADVPVVVVTSTAGAGRLGALRFGSHVTVEVAGDGDVVPAQDIVALAARVGARVVLCEGGPHVIGDLLAARLLDELFLTVAPQVAGRDETTTRLALVEGTAFSAGEAPWAALRSVHQASDHLFLRYDLASGQRGAKAPRS